MKSANGVPFSWFLALFRNNAYVDETTFYFEGEEPGDQHYLGCLPNIDPERPYWAGYSDIPDGFDAATPEELFDLPYYDGKSLRERWREVHIYEIGLVPLEDYIAYYADDYPIDAYE